MVYIYKTDLGELEKSWGNISNDNSFEISGSTYQNGLLCALFV